MKNQGFEVYTVGDAYTYLIYVLCAYKIKGVVKKRIKNRGVRLESEPPIDFCLKV